MYEEVREIKQIDYVVWKEGDHFVSQCLNVDVSSFGHSREEAIKNLKEAVELFFEDEDAKLVPIDSVSTGVESINA